MISSRREVLGTAIAVGVLACAAFANPKKTPVYYLDFEHSNITYWNPRFFGFVNVTTQRMSRSDPIHYVHVHHETLTEFGNNFKVNLYVYEFLSNEYRRSFVETHNKLCEFFDSRKKFMTFLEHIPLSHKSCPFPKGVYHFVNLSFSDVPMLSTFPFSKGRLFINVTQSQTDERVVDAYVDVAIKQRWR